MKRWTKVALGTLLVLGPVLVSPQDDAPDEILTIDVDDIPPSAEEACFRANTARGFSALTDEYVYVEVSSNAHYLLTMFSACPGLKNSFEIAISSRTNRICSNRPGSIAYRGLGRTESCAIRRVERVDSRAAAVTIVEMRTRSD